MNPSKYTISKGSIQYLLNISFSAMRLRLLQTNAIDSKNKLIKVEFPLSCVYYFYSITDTNCTLVIPKNAKLHPKIYRFVKILLSKNLDNIAVVIIQPPLVSCQIEPSTKFSAKLAKTLVNISKTVGTNICERGALGFLLPLSSTINFLSSSSFFSPSKSTAIQDYLSRLTQTSNKYTIDCPTKSKTVRING